MLVFRAISGKELNIKNYKQILEEANKESLYEILKEFENLKKKNINIYSEITLKSMSNHIVKGNFNENYYWISFSKNFRIAYNYAMPSIYRVTNTKKAKTKRSKIIICEFDQDRMFDISNSKIDIVNKYINGHWGSYAKNKEEVLLLGKLDLKYKELTNLQADLLCILWEQEHIDKNYTLEDFKQWDNIHSQLYPILTIVEKMIYDLYFIQNLNLYEIIAPLYYSNNVNILYLYNLILDIITSILNKALPFTKIDYREISSSTVWNMYSSEIHFLCKNYKKYKYENQICDFNCLFTILSEKRYIDSTTDVSELKYLIQNTSNAHSSYVVTTEYPLYLFLPKDEPILKKEYLLFDKENDLYYCYDRCENNPKSSGINIGKFVSEIYIPDTFKKIDEDFLNIDSLAQDQYSDTLTTVYGGRYSNVPKLACANRNHLKVYSNHNKENQYIPLIICVY